MSGKQHNSAAGNARKAVMIEVPGRGDEWGQGGFGIEFHTYINSGETVTFGVAEQKHSANFF
jgi:hypothetical protein